MNIKGFDKNLCCRGMQFEVGKEYKIDLNGRKMKLCTDTVFHYCKSLRDVHKYYDALRNNRYCEIEVLGDEVADGKKCGSNHIKILREIVGEELSALKGHTNGNTGLFNSGESNSGDCNIGSYNSGSHNIGSHNSGSKNSGDNNSGSKNSGDNNSGSYNSGSYNGGSYNIGSYNGGSYNIGSYNSGSYNSGSHNIGSHNSGSKNSGDNNSGSYNRGSHNSGLFNSGSYNSGMLNSCDNSSGVFCNKEENIRIFNVDSGMTARELYNSEYRKALCSAPFILTEWIKYTPGEMENDAYKQSTGGYLKEYSYKEACANWWDKMTDKNKQIIISMPNFNKEIFKDITGIEV